MRNILCLHFFFLTHIALYVKLKNQRKSPGWWLLNLLMLHLKKKNQQFKQTSTIFFVNTACTHGIVRWCNKTTQFIVLQAFWQRTSTPATHLLHGNPYSHTFINILFVHGITERITSSTPYKQDFAFRDGNSQTHQRQSTFFFFHWNSSITPWHSTSSCWRHKTELDHVCYSRT